MQNCIDPKDVFPKPGINLGKTQDGDEIQGCPTTEGLCNTLIEKYKGAH
ncbi:MAG: hypothetical protein ACKVIX_03015 [Sphingomonadales bacterium]